MNFFPNEMININMILNKLSELENRIKRLEERIEKSSNNYMEPDNSLYMI